MRCYEDYSSTGAKRAAQRGANRGRPTGKANGFIFVFNENGIGPGGMVDAVASVYDVPAGGECPDGGMGSTSVSRDYLRTRCRFVGAKYLPSSWAKAWARFI